MNKGEEEMKKFLEEQVEWCKWQDSILEEIENKLHEMKKIAEYARAHELTSIEVIKLNKQLNTMKQEVYFLEQQLQSEINQDCECCSFLCVWKNTKNNLYPESPFTCNYTAH